VVVVVAAAESVFLRALAGEGLGFRRAAVEKGDGRREPAFGLCIRDDFVAVDWKDML
jgi:hypothetical protein